MKKFFGFCLIAISLWSCSSNETSTSSEPVPTNANAEENQANPSSETATNSKPASAKKESDLASMADMDVEEALEIDFMRERIGKDDWGQIMDILTSSNAGFVKSGSCCLVAQGEIKQNGFTWAAEMILDIEQDAVFGVQWDGENKRIDQFEDDIEGLETPAPMIAFTTKYNK